MARRPPGGVSLPLRVSCSSRPRHHLPQAKDWSIRLIDETLDVQKNGDVVVDEKVTFDFSGNYHFVTNSIPTGNLNGFKDLKVYDQNGNELQQGDGLGMYTVENSGDFKYITLNFDLTDTSYTWTFHYRAVDEIMFQDPGDELRWYVFDAETPVTIGAVKATVKLPADVAQDKMSPAVQTGSGIQYTTSMPDARTVVYEATDLPAYTEFWIVAGFPKGVVQQVWTARRVAAAIVPRLGFVLPILFFLGMLLIWRKRGRDDPSKTYASYVSEPPSTLPPALAGALIDEKVDTKEVIATIVDLARRGYIEMTDTPREGTFGKPETIFTRTKPLDDLKGFEKKVADALFDGSHPDQVTSKQLKNHFYTHVQPIVGRGVRRRGHGRPVLPQPEERSRPLDRLRLPGRRSSSRSSRSSSPCSTSAAGATSCWAPSSRWSSSGASARSCLNAPRPVPRKCASGRRSATTCATSPGSRTWSRPRTSSRSTWHTPSPSASRRNGCGVLKV